jgi:hypothetical protein
MLTASPVVDGQPRPGSPRRWTTRVELSGQPVRLPTVAPDRGALRLTRVALFALAAVGLAGAAHLIGGETVSPVAALIAVPAVMVVANLLGSARRGPISLIIAMGFTQIALHIGFMAASLTQACHAVQAPMAEMAGSAGHTSVVLSCRPGMTHGGTALGGLWPSPSMLLAHLGAAALLALLLARGESAVWALAAALGFGFALPATAVAGPVVRRVPVPARIVVLPRTSVWRRGVRRRGPPARALAAH